MRSSMPAVSTLLVRLFALFFACNTVATFAHAAAADNGTANKMYADELMSLALAHMRANAQTAPERRIELDKGNMDARLNMPRCQTPLHFEPQRHNGRGERLLVKTSCLDQKRWSVYVPLQYREYARAVVSQRPIARGTTLGPEDIAVKEIPVHKTGGNFLPSVEQALGMLATRNISAGAALQRNALKAPLLVRRGDQVVIVAKSGPVAVRMNGTALSAGSANQQIRVKNVRSQRVIKARVTGAGVVEALM
ncbi:MAG: flagellar basal body P-ring formation protein FlgA [Gammaproteobacteria bacterium]|nr:flagellar basal body P-ring formation protein FlgA [Gammaproteobacteria bacterium]NNM12095.1 flagellar basal body P-ring formation protein FlgA [Pseudomonadales bacterium]